MIYVEDLPKHADSDPGEYWFRILADEYPELFRGINLEGIVSESIPINPNQDGELQAIIDPLISSGLFEFKRKPVRALFRAVMQRIFDEHRISMGRGLDIGSGATGEMVNEWLPLTRSQRANWIESDINPMSTSANLARHPNSDIRVGSMYDLTGTLSLPVGSIPVVTGLSALDAPDYLDEAVKGVKEVLSQNGHLIHVQDVRPGLPVGIDQLIYEGESSPYFAGVALPPGGLTLETLNPHAYRRHNETWVSSVELFRRRLERSLKDVGGFEILQNNWVVACRPTERESSVYVMNMGGPVSTGHTNSLPVDLAYAVVTVARKK